MIEIGNLKIKILYFKIIMLHLMIKIDHFKVTFSAGSFFVFASHGAHGERRGFFCPAIFFLWEK